VQTLGWLPGARCAILDAPARGQRGDSTTGLDLFVSALAEQAPVVFLAPGFGTVWARRRWRWPRWPTSAASRWCS
jgi:hypothetical protein